MATLVNIINRNVLRFEELNQENEMNKMKNKLNDSSLDNNGYISGIESNEKLITEAFEFSDIDKNKKKLNKLDLKELNNDFEENEVEENENGKNDIKEEESKLNNNKSNLAFYKKFKIPKNRGGILKKRTDISKGFKRVGIKTINEENQQNEEDNNAKENTEKDETILNDDYKPLPESDKEVIIVDFIIENVPNLIDIIKGLFNKDSMDISSLTIMFCCNLLDASPHNLILLTAS